MAIDRQNLLQKAFSSVRKKADELLDRRQFISPQPQAPSFSSDVMSGMRKMTGLIDRDLSKLANSNLGAVSTFGNFTRNFNQNVGQAGQNIVSGVGGMINAGIKNKPLQSLQSAGKLAKGAGQFAVNSSPLYQTANLVSSMPNNETLRLVDPNDRIRRTAAGLTQGITQADNIARNVPQQQTQVNLPVVGQVGIDPYNFAGQSLGFVRNPFNKKVLQNTQGLKVPGINNKVANWVATTAARGGMEDVFMNLDKLPTESKKDALGYLATTFLAGSAQEFVGQGISKGGAAIANAPRVAYNRMIDALFEKVPTMTEGQADQAVKQFIRDEMGRFAKSGRGQAKKEPVFYGDLRAAVGLPRDGNYQGGFIKMDEFVGNPTKSLDTRVPTKQLTKLGYSQEMISKMPDNIKQKIVSENLTPNKLKELFERKGTPELETRTANAELNQSVRSLFSDDQIKDINRLKSMSKSKAFQEGDIETLRTNNQKLVEKVVESVREIPGYESMSDVDALDMALSFPTKQGTRVKLPTEIKTANTLQSQINRASKVFQDKYQKLINNNDFNQIDKQLNNQIGGTKVNRTSLQGKALGKTNKELIDLANQQRKQVQDKAEAVLNLPNLNKDVKAKFKDWVNLRRASKIAGAAKKQEFKDLDAKGIQGFFDVQRGSREGRYGDVRKFFDDKFKELEDAGVRLNYQKDYLTQLWQNSESEVMEKMGRFLGLKPGFTLEKVIESYQKGIAGGLQPRFNKISDLAAWYEGRANKVLADKTFFDTLVDDGMLIGSSAAPKNWVTVDPDRFPTDRFKAGEINITEPYKAPKELADLINNYLRQPEGALNTIATYSSAVKNIVLSAGVPYTSINFHAANILARHTMAAKNPFKELVRGLYFTAKWKAGKGFVDKNLDLANKAVKRGLTLSVEDYDTTKEANALLSKTKLGGVTQKYLDFMHENLERPLFEGLIPALKLKHWDDVTQDLIKDGYSEKQAGEVAAKITNNIYGGINVDEIGRSKEMQNILRSVFLASDWGETNLKLLEELPKSVVKLNNKEAVVYRRMVRNLMGMLVGANVVNYISTGHTMWGNESGHTFEIDTGMVDDEGKKIYYRPFGTAADFIRLPYDIAIALKRGDIDPIFRTVRNRMSVPLSVAGGLFFNVDYRGNPIYGKDRFYNPMSLGQSLAGVGGEVSRLFTPPQVKTGIDLVSGKISGIEAASQAIEAPIRFSKPYEPEPAPKTDFSEIPVIGKAFAADEGTTTDVFTMGKQQDEEKKAIKEIFEDDSITLDERRVKAKDMGYIPDIVERRVVGGYELNRRKIWINQKLQSKDVDRTGFLLNLRIPHGGDKPMMSNGLIDDLVKEQTIDKFTGDMLKKAQWNEKENKLDYPQELYTTSDIDRLYYGIASDTADNRRAFIAGNLAKFGQSRNRQAFLQFLANGRKEVNGKTLITNGDIDDLRRIGLLTTNEKNQLKKLRYTNKTAKAKMTQRGTSARLKKFRISTPPKPRRLRVNNTKISRQQLNKIKL